MQCSAVKDGCERADVKHAISQFGLPCHVDEEVGTAPCPFDATDDVSTATSACHLVLKRTNSARGSDAAGLIRTEGTARGRSQVIHGVLAPVHERNRVTWFSTTPFSPPDILSAEEHKDCAYPTEKELITGAGILPSYGCSQPYFSTLTVAMSHATFTSSGLSALKPVISRILSPASASTLRKQFPKQPRTVCAINNDDSGQSSKWPQMPASSGVAGSLRNFIIATSAAAVVLFGDGSIVIGDSDAMAADALKTSTCLFKSCRQARQRHSTTTRALSFQITVVDPMNSRMRAFIRMVPEFVGVVRGLFE